MADSYLSIAAIAGDRNMTERLNAATTQQAQLGNSSFGPEPIDPSAYGAVGWVQNNRYLWASSPGWGAAWDSALASHPDDDTYEPGKDPAVITDEMILATVQTLAPAS